ncbi:MAG TPA: hypothetical protein V6D28_17905 [Leptolyngbyaceae cyanobacterium]
MAKRRNLKKEKALRNQAYARKYRKRKMTGNFSSRRRNQSAAAEGAEEEIDA